MEWDSNSSSDDSTRGQLDPKIRTILGGRSVNAFYHMPKALHKTALRRSLVRHSPIHFDVSNYEERDDESANTALFRPQGFARLSRTAQLVASEAQTLYYGKNHFVVWLYWLSEFVADSLHGKQNRINVAPLVGAITVNVGLHDDGNVQHMYNEDSKDNEVDETGRTERRGEGRLALWAQRQLHALHGFTKAKKVVLRLQGDGMLNGSDLATLQTIRDIVEVVGELMERFGEGLDVVKVVKGSGRGGREDWAQSIRSYWDKPEEEMVKRVREGDGSFVDYIQVKVEEWRQEAKTSHHYRAYF